MEIIEYKRIFDSEKEDFWHVGRREILDEAISRHAKKAQDRKILDVGCGPGGNILLLKDFGRVTGLDTSEEALKFAKSNGFDTLVQSSAVEMSFEDESFEMVVALDVFEHVEDDNSAIKESVRVLKPDGLLVATVPAYPFLWSPHDESMHHVRRYIKKDLMSKIKKYDIEICEHTHFFMPAVPFRIFQKFRDKIFRKKTDKKQIAYKVEYTGLFNSFLLFLSRVERFMLRFLRLPFGTSILIIARKNKKN
jgi:ubiquinone/menaquinone biosynthesis C-methylase UbiE